MLGRSLSVHSELAGALPKHIYIVLLFFISRQIKNTSYHIMFAVEHHSVSQLRQTCSACQVLWILSLHASERHEGDCSWHKQWTTGNEIFANRKLNRDDGVKKPRKIHPSDESHLLVRQDSEKIVPFFFLPLQLDSSNGSPVQYWIGRHFVCIVRALIETVREKCFITERERPLFNKALRRLSFNDA